MKEGSSLTLNVKQDFSQYSFELDHLIYRKTPEKD